MRVRERLGVQAGRLQGREVSSRNTGKLRFGIAVERKEARKLASAVLGEKSTQGGHYNTLLPKIILSGTT